MQDRYYTSYFSTPSNMLKQRDKAIKGPNGWLLLVACNSGLKLAENVKTSYEMIYSEIEHAQIEVPLIGSENNPITRVFNDSETCPRLPIHVAGSDAYVFQNVHNKDYGNSANENIQQLIQVVRTLKTHRAKTITVVLPYLPYSRQDKPSFMKREAALASLFADQLKIAGTDICLTYHPHTSSVYGFFEPEIKLVALSGLDLFKAVFSKFHGDSETVIVSTDAGGAKEVIYFAEKLSVTYAISSKFRKQKDSAKIIGLVGDTKNKKRAIVIDDETVTANSVINTVKTLYEVYEIHEIYVALSHFKLGKENVERLKEANKKYGLREVHITDTIPQNKDMLEEYPFIYAHTLSEIFAATINKLHYNESVSQIFSRL